MYAIIANHSAKTVIVEEYDSAKVEKYPREAIGFMGKKGWAQHIAGYMARERGYEFVKDNHEDSHHS